MTDRILPCYGSTDDDVIDAVAMRLAGINAVAAPGLVAADRRVAKARQRAERIVPYALEYLAGFRDPSDAPADVFAACLTYTRKRIRESAPRALGVIPPWLLLAIASTVVRWVVEWALDRLSDPWWQQVQAGRSRGQ